MDELPVVVREYPDGKVILLFPTMPSAFRGLYSISWSRSGEHRWWANYYYVIEETKPVPLGRAKLIVADYQEMYNDDRPMRIYQKVSHKMHQERRKKSKQIGLYGDYLREFLHPTRRF